MKNINEIIEGTTESFMKEFERHGVSLSEDEDEFKFESPEPSVILNWHKSQQHKLLQSIVEEINTMMNNTPQDGSDAESIILRTLYTLKAKLTTNIKE
jgi:hypothetical protein